MSGLVAIDPGKSGGIAYTLGGLPVAMKMPESASLVVRTLSELRSGGMDRLVIEQIPKFVGKNIPSSTTAVLFENFGIITGAAIALGYRLERVDPHTWQKGLGLGTKRDCKSDGEWKRKLRSKAQELYPRIAVTLSTSDALLIYDYGMKHSPLTS